MRQTPVVAAMTPHWNAAGAVSLFPDETEPGFPLTQARMRELSPLYDALTERMLGSLAGAMARRGAMPAAAAAVLVRSCLAPLLHFFFDRLVRLSLLRASLPDQQLGVVRSPADPPRDALEIQSLAHDSPRFNQALLAMLAPMLGMETMDPDVQPEQASRASSGRARNFNFTPVALPRKVATRLSAAAKSLVFRGAGGPIPCLSMAYSTAALKAEGFYPRLLVDVQRRAVLGDAPRDDAARASLAAAARSEAGAVSDFLGASGIMVPGGREAVLSRLGEFLVWAYPSALLEAVSGNLAACVEVLKPYVPKPLLVGEMANLEAIYMMASAKCLGMEVVGIQHGGHFGYTDDHLCVAMMEFGYADRYVSWGWEKLPPFASCGSTKVVSLPNPWLAERRAYWKRVLPGLQAGPKAKPFDFLLMSPKIYHYAPAPSSATIPRSDCAAEIAAMLKGLVGESCGQGVRILHKPFDRMTARFFRKTFEELERLGGGNYRCLETLDKGLTPDLLKQCHVVLWDQVGTGLLECLQSGVPTMACWPRIYNREDEDALPFMRELEDAGIIHRDVPSLLESLKAFRASPTGWMNEPRRVKSVQRFCRRYAWAEDAWPARWRTFLAGLGGRPSEGGGGRG